MKMDEKINSDYDSKTGKVVVCKRFPLKKEQYEAIQSIDNNFGKLYFFNTIGIEDGEVKSLDLSDRLYNLAQEPIPLNPSIGKLTSLEFLNLRNNFLKDLPKEIGNLKNLKKLNLDNNKLKELPEEIGYLNSLEGLYLKENELKYLPESMKNLILLRELYLDFNNLKEFPDEIINNLKALEQLSLRFNHLTTLPESIINLENLKFLDVNRGNQLDKKSRKILRKLVRKNVYVRY